MIDLRSDTLTRPTPQMREAMAKAPVGDDVYGEDPTVNALEERTAELLGHSAGMFVPSGTMSNMIATAVQVPRGQEMICDELAHVVRAEVGAHAALFGITTRTFDSGGDFRAELPMSMLSPGSGYNSVRTALIEVENTHNFSGGRVARLPELRALREQADTAEVAVHMDGARLFNAAVATGDEPAEIAGTATTVSVCFSKGLGAPVGSMLVGPEDLIAQARVLRKRLGGGMRQAGVLAAAADYALDHHIARLAEDNARAHALATAVAQDFPEVVDPEAVDTNIVVLDLSTRPGTAFQAVDALRGDGVLASALDAQTLRLVTHMGFADEQFAPACAALRAAL